MRNQRYHHGGLDAALLDEALVQVRRRGAERVSLRALASAVGAAPSATYGHFDNRDALLSEVGQRGFTMLGERIRARTAAVAGDGDAVARSRLRAAGTAYVEFALDEPHLCRLMFGPLCSASDRGDAGEGSYGILAQELRQLEAHGSLRVPADQALHLLIWSVIHGFASLVIEGRIDAGNASALIDTVGRLILMPAAT